MDIACFLEAKKHDHVKLMLAKNVLTKLKMDLSIRDIRDADSWFSKLMIDMHVKLEKRQPAFGHRFQNLLEVDLTIM